MSEYPDYTIAAARALDFFRRRVATDLGGFSDSTFWSGSVLRVAQQDASVRHATMALASLSETILNTSHEMRNSAVTPSAFAIRQHSKAISNLSRSIQKNDEPSVEIVLLTCALFICFEMFQDSFELALRQMLTGLSVFYEWHSKCRRGTQSNSRHDSPANIRGFAAQLQHLFERLMLQTILFIDAKPREWRFIAPSFTPMMPRIPHAFASLEEARDCLNTCLCSIYHGALAFQFQALEDPGFSGPETKLSALDEWIRSFEASVANHETQFSFKEQEAKILLEIQQMTGNILVVAGAHAQETVFDSFERTFSRVVDLAARIVINLSDSPQCPKSTCPSFDMCILPHLYFVASRCRHPTIRRQALHLLRQGPSQEGIWHSHMLSNVAERLMTIEEMDCDNVHSSADVPASVRLSVLNATIHPVQRIVALYCCRQQVVASGEKTQVLHESVTY